MKSDSEQSRQSAALLKNRIAFLPSLLICLAFIPASESTAVDGEKSDEKIDSVYSYHLDFVKDRVADSMLDYSQIEIQDHFYFLESLTGIESHADYSSLGIFYFGPPARIDYENWRDWYNNHKTILEWDQLHELIKIEDPAYQKCSELSPRIIRNRKSSRFEILEIFYCVEWSTGSPCSPCLIPGADTSRYLISLMAFYSEEMLADSSATSQIVKLTIEDEEEALDFIEILEACKLSPRFEFKYICPRIECSIFGPSRYSEVWISNTGLMKLDDCVYDTDPKLLELLAKYLPAGYFYPNK